LKVDGLLFYHIYADLVLLAKSSPKQVCPRHDTPLSRASHFFVIYKTQVPY